MSALVNDPSLTSRPVNRAAAYDEPPKATNTATDAITFEYDGRFTTTSPPFRVTRTSRRGASATGSLHEHRAVRGLLIAGIRASERAGRGSVGVLPRRQVGHQRLPRAADDDHAVEVVAMVD